MKKIISLALCVMMMLTALAVSTSAAGNILFTDDFTNGFSASNWILEGNLYFYDDTGSNPCISAYADGVICQAEYRTDVTGSPRVYNNCDYSVRMKVNDFDRDGDHDVGLWWRDDFDDGPAGVEPDWEPGEVWNVVVNVDNQEVRLEVQGEEAPRATAPAPCAEVGGDWFQLGWKVTTGRMCVYLNGEKVIDYASEDIACVHKSPFLLMNGNCFASYDDIVIADLEYNLFGDNNVDNGGSADATTTEATTTQGTTSETTTKIVEEVVTNEKGETSVVTKVVTEATTTPKAETNNKPAGGTSTSTGDATFVVVAAMVATLGCAVIVKKVSVR